MKKRLTILAALLLCLSITAVCIPTFAADPSAVITFSDGAVTLSEGASGVTVKDTAVTITSSGVYEFVGSCSDGSIAVGKKNVGKVEIVLKGLDLTCKTSAPISCKSGTVVTVTAEEGTQNTLSDTDRDSDKPRSAINSSGDLILDGKGSLTVNGNNKNGIKADGSVTVKDLKLTVKSKDDCVSADNVLTVDSGSLTLVSESGECLKSGPEEISAKTAGKIIINGGTIVAEAETNDTVKGVALVEIRDGDIDLKTNGGSKTVVSENDTGSYKGIKSNSNVVISGGRITVDSADDAIQCESNITVSGGYIYLKAGGDGLDADSITVGSGSVIIDNPSTGKRAFDYNTALTVNGGTVVASETTNDEAPVSDGKQCFVIFDADTSADSVCAVKKTDTPEAIAVFRPSNASSRMIFSSIDIIDGETYDLFLGGPSAADIQSGRIYAGSDFSGTKTASSKAGKPVIVPEPTTVVPTTQPTTVPEPSTQNTTTQPVTEPTTQPATAPTTQPSTDISTTAVITTQPTELPATTTQPATVPSAATSVTTIPPTTVIIPAPAKGDLTGDGTVNAEDARICLRIAAKLDNVTDPGVLASADVDGNGNVNAVDARIILRVAAKLQTF